MRRTSPLGILSALCAVVVFAGCHGATSPAAPQTREDAIKAFDAAIAQMAWAQVDLWKLGGRDIVVSVQLDTSLAPHYFRLPRKAP